MKRQFDDRHAPTGRTMRAGILGCVLATALALGACGGPRSSTSGSMPPGVDPPSTAPQPAPTPLPATAPLASNAPRPEPSLASAPASAASPPASAFAFAAHIPAGTLYVCAGSSDGTQTPIEYEPKVRDLCARHPEMGVCQYGRDACRARGGRVYDASGVEITKATEAEYDRKVMRIRFRS